MDYREHVGEIVIAHYPDEMRMEPGRLKGYDSKTKQYILYWKGRKEGRWFTAPAFVLDEKSDDDKK